MKPAEFKKELLHQVNQALVTDPDCLNGPGYFFKVGQSSFVVNSDKLAEFKKQLNKLKGQNLDQKGKPWKTPINTKGNNITWDFIDR